MIIRSKQIFAFQPLVEKSFIQNIKDYLLEEHSETIVHFAEGNFELEKIPHNTLDRLIQNGVHQANNYGIDWESEIVSFVSLMFVIAPNFHLHPFAKQVLTNEKIEPNRRLKELIECATEEEWEKAEQNYDVKAWD